MGRDADGNYTGPDITRRERYSGGGYQGPQSARRNGGDDGLFGDIRDALRDIRGVSRDVSGATRDTARAWGGIRSWGAQSDTVYYRNAGSAANAEYRYNTIQERDMARSMGMSTREFREWRAHQAGPQNYTLNGQPLAAGTAAVTPYGYGQPNYDAYGIVPPRVAPQVQPTIQPQVAPQVLPPVAPAAVAPQVTPVPPAAGAAAAAPVVAAASATPPAAPAAVTSESPALVAASGASTRVYSVRRQPAPHANEIPKIAQNQVEALQDMLIAAGHSVGPMGSDGKYGPNTHTAIKALAATLTPPITDLTTIDFTNPQDPETQRFMTALAPQRAAAPVVAAAPAGPTPEQLAAQQRAAAEAQARAAEEARIPESIRGTPFDPRNLARMSQQERYDLARHALHGIDELASENSRPNLERMHDKMDESVRWSNEHLGTRIARPSPADPLSVDAMVALGLRAANRGGLSNDRNQIINLPENMTQAAMDSMAIQYIRALDRGVNSEDPSRAIRRFEERDMGRSGIEADGLADPQMLAALRQAVAVRNGLTDPNAVAAAPVAPQAPAAVASTVPPLPPTVTGGAETGGPQGAAPVAPAGQPVQPTSGRTA